MTFSLRYAKRIPNGAKPFRVLVGNVDVELLLELHHQLDDVEAIGTQIIDEAGFVGELLTLDTELLLDDVFHFLRVVRHDLSPSCDG